ncbi:hypothetical protein [Kutzneria buriramensis]
MRIPAAETGLAGDYRTSMSYTSTGLMNVTARSAEDGRGSATCRRKTAS